MANGLRELRRRKLLTQRELADRIGMRYQSVQSWENGQTIPRPSAMRKLCEALAVTPDELLAALEETHPDTGADKLPGARGE